MESVPVGSFLVTRVAVPPLKVVFPSHRLPFLNKTVPVGPPGAPELTVAESCTVCPSAEGFGLELTIVLVE
jgi:hypothetical protein